MFLRYSLTLIECFSLTNTSTLVVYYDFRESKCTGSEYMF